MDPRRFFDLARELFARGGEEAWRSAVGRAYYALLLACRDALARWDFPPPPASNVHRQTRVAFERADDTDLKVIGVSLGDLAKWRVIADSELSDPAPRGLQFVRRAIEASESALGLLDAIDADPIRRADAVRDLAAASPP